MRTKSNKYNVIVIKFVHTIIFSFTKFYSSIILAILYKSKYKYFIYYIKYNYRYLVFFKGRDADVLTAAFREFSKKKLDKERKPSVRRDLAEKKAEAAQTAKRDKVKNMDRGIDR